MNDKVKEIEIDLNLSADSIINKLQNRNLDFKEDWVRTAIFNLKDMELLKQERFLKDEQFDAIQSEIVNALLAHLYFQNNWRFYTISIK